MDHPSDRLITAYVNFPKGQSIVLTCFIERFNRHTEAVETRSQQACEMIFLRHRTMRAAAQPLPFIT
jgi:hypothetical protein